MLHLRSGRRVDRTIQHIPIRTVNQIISNLNVINIRDVHQHSDPTCPICLDNIEPHNSHTIQQCNHTFHTSCIIDWFRNNHRCPMCRDNGFPRPNDLSESLQNLSRAAENKVYYLQHFRYGRIKLLKEIARYQDCPPKLKELMNQYNSLENTTYKLSQKLGILKRPIAKVDFKKQKERISQLKKQINQNDIEMRILEGQLSCFRASEIIIERG